MGHNDLSAFILSTRIKKCAFCHSDERSEEESLRFRTPRFLAALEMTETENRNRQSAIYAGDEYIQLLSSRYEALPRNAATEALPH
jgi:hypothetical protein